jgi:ABC-2 type transport system permease protein
MMSVSSIFVIVQMLLNNTIEEKSNRIIEVLLSSVTPGELTLVMMVPLMTMMFIPKDPNGPLARILSWISIYTPFTMMNRANAGPPWIDLIGTLILLLATTALALWMSGKIFRIGVLRTGQPPKIVELLRWAVRKAQ